MDERCFRKTSNLYRDLQGSRRNSFEDPYENQLYSRQSFNNNELVKGLLTFILNNKPQNQIPFP